MSLGPRLDLRQSQQLVMTPQLQQAIKLLTLTNLELETFIQTEIDKNPLLEAAGDDAPVPGEVADSGEPFGDMDSDGLAADGFEAPDPPSSDQLMATGDVAADAPLDVDYTAETFHHDSGPDSAVGGQDGSLGLNGATVGGGGDGEGFEAMLAADRTLADVLEEQAALTFDGNDLVIARQLIDLPVLHHDKGI